MNYLQHNKNQVAVNGGPVLAKNLEGKAGSQAALHQYNQPGNKRTNNLFTQGAQGTANGGPRGAN